MSVCVCVCERERDRLSSSSRPVHAERSSRGATRTELGWRNRASFSFLRFDDARVSVIFRQPIVWCGPGTAQHTWSLMSASQPAREKSAMTALPAFQKLFGGKLKPRARDGFVGCLFVSIVGLLLIETSARGPARGADAHVGSEGRRDRGTRARGRGGDSARTDRQQQAVVMVRVGVPRTTAERDPRAGPHHRRTRIAAGRAATKAPTPPPLPLDRGAAGGVGRDPPRARERARTATTKRRRRNCDRDRSIIRRSIGDRGRDDDGRDPPVAVDAGVGERPLVEVAHDALEAAEDALREARHAHTHAHPYRYFRVVLRGQILM